MTERLVFGFAVIAFCAVLSGCGPDCSSGGFGGDVKVIDNDVFHWEGPEASYYLGRADDRDLFRGCEAINGFLNLVRPESYRAFDDLVGVGHLFLDLFDSPTEEGPPELATPWDLPPSALPSLEVIPGNLWLFGAYQIDGLNALEVAGDVRGLCFVNGLNSLHTVGSIGLGDAREGPVCDQSGLVSLREVVEDLEISGYEAVGPTGPRVREDVLAYPWPTYALPGQIAKVGRDVRVTGGGRIVLSEVREIGRDLRADPSLGARLFDLKAPALERVGWGVHLVGRDLSFVTVPARLEAHHLVISDIDNVEDLEFVGSFGHMASVVFINNRQMTTDVMHRFVDDHVLSYDELLHCRNADDAASCEGVDLAFINEGPQ